MYASLTSAFVIAALLVLYAHNTHVISVACVVGRYCKNDELECEIGRQKKLFWLLPAVLLKICSILLVSV